MNDWVPSEFYLGQNYPNPFKEKTIIKYCVADKTRVQITVYDSIGKEIEKLVDEEQQPGTYQVEFFASRCHSGESRNLVQGYYYYRMIAGEYSSEKKWFCINNLLRSNTMRTFLQTLFFFLLVTQICFGQLHRNWLSQAQEEYNPLSLNTNSSLDSFFTAYMSTYHVPGIAACIIKNDSVFWTGYYGKANIALNIPVTDSTIFYIASISKTIVATALMQLYEQGYFQLEDSINAYLPFPVRTPAHPEVPITFKMLLTHTNSIQDNWDVLDQIVGPGDPTMPLGTFLSEYLTPGGQYYSQNLNFFTQTPGTYCYYSNIGAALAGYLVEVLSGIPLDEYCRDSIFIPLNMSHTAWFLRDLDTTLVTRPYGYYFGTHNDYGLYGFPDYPDGLLKTTLPSFAKFLLMNMRAGELGGVRILDTATIHLMRTVYSIAPPSPGGYIYQFGLIWLKPLYWLYDLWGHTGGGYGATAAMFLRESDNTGIILLTNLDYGNQNFEIVVDRLFSEITVGVQEEYIEIPESFILTQNFPNPFNPSTKIKYLIPQSSNVVIKVFDILGKEIETLVNEEKHSGTYEVTWYAGNLPSGVYFYQIKAGSFVETKKMILLR